MKRFHLLNDFDIIKPIKHACFYLSLVLLASVSLQSQVALENNAVATIPQGTTATSISLSNYNPGTANNRVMLVAVTTSRRQVFSATFGGSPLTSLGTVVNGNSYVRFFYMLNPPSNPATLSASLESDDRGFAMGSLLSPVWI